MTVRTLKYKPLTADEDAELVRRFALGHTDGCIAAAIGTSAGSVAQSRQRLGLKRVSNRKVWDAAKDEIVRAEYPRCRNKRALAARLDCSPSHLRVHAACLGVRDELHAEAAALRERARLIGRDARPPMPVAEEARLCRSRQLLTALAGQPRSLRWLWRQGGWGADYVHSICRESPEVVRFDGWCVVSVEGGK